MASNQIEEVKSKTDIVSLISEYIEVKKAGRNYKANCPFHGEKTPSFMISPELQMYKCFGCFPAGQFVKTPFGAHEIQNIVEGEYVVSGKGNLQKVLVRHERLYKGDIAIIKLSQFTEPVNLTEDHVVNIIGGADTYKFKYKNLSRRLNFFSKHYSDEKKLEKTWKYFPIEEIKAGGLKKGMSLLYPIDFTVNDFDRLDLSDYITKKWPSHGKKPLIPELEVKIDDSLLRLIGYYIAEGSGHRAYVRFSIGDHEVGFAKDICAIVKKTFDLDAQVCRKHNGKKSGTEISVCNSILSNVFENLCGKGVENKHIPFAFQHLEPKKQMILLNAIFRGDGHEEKARGKKKTIRNVITTVSRTLSEQLTDILLRNGFYPSKYIGKEHIDKNNVKHKKVFIVSWSVNPKVSKFHHIYKNKDGICYRILPILKVSRNKFSGKVYNLTVENDHSYVSNNFSVSNCGRSGDVFTFIEEHEGMSFGEALKYLAEKAGVKLTKFKDDDFSEKEKIISINEKALNFYDYVLNVHPSGKKVIEYLIKDRGLKLETIKQFKIGYSPNSYDALYKYLTIKQKFNAPDLVKAGLIAGRTMDRFKGRVVFPLFDHREKIVGFSGRILPWIKQDMAKYINSPDTPAYHKSKMLYGLNITKQFIREKQIAIVVEGELDMISSFQVGVKNVVAIKGSALTEDHLRLIGRFCKRIILCLDSDFAGDEAAKRGAIMAVDMGFDVKVCELNTYKDPDDAARGNPNEYKKTLDSAIGIWDFLINQIFEKYDSSTGNGKAEISKEIKPLLAQIKDKIVQAYYIEMVSRKLSVPVEVVTTEVSKIKTSDNVLVSELVEIKSKKNRRQLLEEKLLVNATENNIKILQKKEILDLIKTEFVKKIINYLNKNGMPLPKELTAGYAEMVMENSEADEINLIIKELTKLDLKEKQEVLGEKIKSDSENEELLKEFDKLSKKLSAL